VTSRILKEFSILMGKSDPQWDMLFLNGAGIGNRVKGQKRIIE